MPRRPTEFQTIRSEGGLLPPDLLRRVVDPAGKVSGVEPPAYGLPAGERINEAITQSWNRLRRHWAEFRAACGANSEWRIANGQEAQRSPPSSSVPPLATPHSPITESEALTGLTNDKWSLPLLRELGFGFLTATAGPTIDGKTYAISRFAVAPSPSRSRKIVPTSIRQMWRLFVRGRVASDAWRIVLPGGGRAERRQARDLILRS